MRRIDAVHRNSLDAELTRFSVVDASGGMDESNQSVMAIKALMDQPGFSIYPGDSIAVVEIEE